MNAADATSALFSACTSHRGDVDVDAVFDDDDDADDDDDVASLLGAGKSVSLCEMREVSLARAAMREAAATTVELRRVRARSSAFTVDMSVPSASGNSFERGSNEAGAGCGQRRQVLCTDEEADSRIDSATMCGTIAPDTKDVTTATSAERWSRRALFVLCAATSWLRVGDV